MPALGLKSMQSSWTVDSGKFTYAVNQLCEDLLRDGKFAPGADRANVVANLRLRLEKDPPTLAASVISSLHCEFEHP